MNRTGFLTATVVVVAGLLAAALFWPKQEGVTVYCAHDDVYARPILEDFERETGIVVKAEFDTEAAKTIGLVNRLRLERSQPRCDVFWNNEILHTVRLAAEGALEPYVSPSAADVPAEFKDAKGAWTGFAARPRVLILTTDAAMWPDADRPDSMDDLADPKWKGRCAFVKPLTGTTLTHAVVLSTVLGREKAVKWFEALFANDCRFPTGNGALAASVGLRQVAFGFTDIDDFNKQRLEGKPVDVVYPDQGAGAPGTLLIPNTVALVKGGPRPDLGRKLVDYLLSPKVEERLAASGSAQVPLRPGVPHPPLVKVPGADFRPMKVDWADAAAHYDERFKELEALWSR